MDGSRRRSSHFLAFYGALTSSLPSLEARERGRPSCEDPTLALASSVGKRRRELHLAAKRERAKASSSPLDRAKARLGLPERRLLQMQRSDGFWKVTRGFIRALLGPGVHKLPKPPDRAGTEERWATALAACRLREQPSDVFAAVEKGVTAAIGALHDDKRLLRAARLALPPRSVSAAVPPQALEDGSWLEATVERVQTEGASRFAQHLLDDAEEEEEEEEEVEGGVDVVALRKKRDEEKKRKDELKDRRFASGVTDSDSMPLLAMQKTTSSSSSSSASSSSSPTTSSLAIREMLRAQVEGEVLREIEGELKEVKLARKEGLVPKKEKGSKEPNPLTGLVEGRPRPSSATQRRLDEEEKLEVAEGKWRETEWKWARRAVGAVGLREGEEVESFWRRPALGRPAELHFSSDAGLGPISDRSHSHLSAGSTAWARAEKRRRKAEAKIHGTTPLPVAAGETGVGPRRGHPAVVVRVWKGGHYADIRFLDGRKEEERRVATTLLLRHGVDRRLFVPGRGSFEDVPLPLHLDALHRLWGWDKTTRATTTSPPPAPHPTPRDGMKRDEDEDEVGDEIRSSIPGEDAKYGASREEFSSRLFASSSSPSSPSPPSPASPASLVGESDGMASHWREQESALSAVPTFTTEASRLQKLHASLYGIDRPPWTMEFAKRVPPSVVRAQEAQRDAKERAAERAEAKAEAAERASGARGAKSKVLRKVRKATKELHRELAPHEVEATARLKIRKHEARQRRLAAMASKPKHPYLAPQPGLTPKKKKGRKKGRKGKGKSGEDEEAEVDEGGEDLGPVPRISVAKPEGTLEWALDAIDAAEQVTRARKKQERVLGIRDESGGEDGGGGEDDELAARVAASLARLDVGAARAMELLEDGERRWYTSLTLSQRQRAFAPLTQQLRQMRQLVIQVVADVRKWQGLPPRPQWDIPEDRNDVVNPEDAPSKGGEGSREGEERLVEKPWLWQGRHWYEHVAHILDRLGRSQCLRLWYGDRFPMHRNPLSIPYSLDQHPPAPKPTRRWRWVAGVMELHTDARLVALHKDAEQRTKNWEEGFAPGVLPGAGLGAREEGTVLDGEDAAGAAPAVADLMWDRERLKAEDVAEASVDAARAATEALDGVAGGTIRWEAAGARAIVARKVVLDAKKAAGVEDPSKDQTTGVPFWWPCRDMTKEHIHEARVAAAGILDAEKRGW